MLSALDTQACDCNCLDGSVSEDGLLSGNVTARSDGGDEISVGLTAMKDVPGLCMCSEQMQHAITSAGFSEVSLLLPVQPRQIRAAKVDDSTKECNAPTLHRSGSGE